jgi:hypothetical protein
MTTLVNYTEHAEILPIAKIPLFPYIYTVPFAELLIMLGFNKSLRDATPTALSPKHVFTHPTFSGYNYVIIIINNFI